MIRSSALMSAAMPVALVAALAGSATAQDRLHTSILTALSDRIGPQQGLVTIIEQAFTTSDGRLGFTGQDGFLNRFVWYDDAPVFFSTQDAPPGFSISGSDSTMGIGADGSWVIGTNINLNKGIWSDRGFVTQINSPEPTLAPTTFSALQRVTMTDDGTTYFIGDLATDGGPRESRGLVRINNYGTAQAQFDVVYRAGLELQTTDGSPAVTIGSNSSNSAVQSTGGVNPNYNVSNNNRFVIGTMDVRGDGLGVTNDGSVALFDTVANTNTLLLREGTATGQGDNFDNWLGAAVNNSGNWIAFGDTDAATNADHILVSNGQIAMREGESFNDLTLGSILQAGINNLNDIISVWSLGAGQEAVFFAGQGDFNATQLLLQTGDGVDIDGDGISDGIVRDIVTDSFAMDISDSDTLYLKIKFDDLSGFDPVDAMIAVTIPAPGAVGLFSAVGLLATRRRR